MARWIVQCVMVLAGCLMFISTGEAARDNVGVALTAKSSDSRPSNTRSNNMRSTTKRKRKRVKGKIKYREKFPEERDSDDTDDELRRHKGTYGLTAATWEAAFMRGDVYNGVAYFDTVRYNNTPDTMPTICQNVDVYDNTNANVSTEVSDNMTQSLVPGLFYCPGDDDNDDKNFCCGGEETEYCCAGPVNSEVTPVLIGALIGAIFLIMGIALFFLWRKKRQDQLKLEEKVPPQEKAAEPMLAPNTAAYQQPGTGAPADAYLPQLPPGQQDYPPQPPPDQQGYPPQPPLDQAASSGVPPESSDPPPKAV
ncbi:uncharacterized protein [Haliotis asinina]|uniref:uncharacterized protein isoform X2 n=1 Tax=Haliotis asinina TaxID=109174 RepID=UPI003531C1A5